MKHRLFFTIVLALTLAEAKAYNDLEVRGDTVVCYDLERTYYTVDSYIKGDSLYTENGEWTFKQNACGFLKDGLLYKFAFGNDVTLVCYDPKTLPDTLVFDPSTLIHNGQPLAVGIRKEALREAPIKALIWKYDRDVKEKMFYSCPLLRSVDFRNTNPIDIAPEAFSSCSSLENISINGNVKGIDTKAFSRCKNLKSLVLPECVKYIRPGAFADCTSLTSVKIKNPQLDNGVKRSAAMYFKNAPVCQKLFEAAADKRRPNEARPQDKRFRIDKKSKVIVY